MTEKRQPDLFSAEFWAKSFAEISDSTYNIPIMNFKFNIKKAKLLYETALKINTILANISKKNPDKSVEKPIDKIADFAETGLALYYVYTEQALVTAVSASEVYFRDRMAYAIQNDKRLLNRFVDKEIKVKRILDAGLDLSKDIGILIVENMNFQILDNVKDEYERIFGFELFTKEELKKLKEIFAIRHVIVHKSGIVDHLFVLESGLSYQVGKRLCFERDEILQMIEFVDRIVTNIDSKLPVPLVRTS